MACVTCSGRGVVVSYWPNDAGYVAGCNFCKECMPEPLSAAEVELAQLRMLCRRILATHDRSAYAKGPTQELWREFAKAVECEK